MNLNYDNLNIEGISEEVKAKYAFPQDKVFLSRYMKGGMSLQTREEREGETNKDRNRVILCTLSLGAGIVSYLSLLNPNGKVLRDAYDATLPLWRRTARRVVPFTLLTLPFFYGRTLLDARNFDYKN